MPATQHSADVLIIGGGPAGLAAALSLSRLLFTAIVFDSGEYRNQRAEHMHNVPTWDHREPKEYRAAARKELLHGRYTTTSFVERHVVKVEKKLLDGGSGSSSYFFQATDSGGHTYTGRKVVLATGVRDVYPAIEGYDECWGRGIFHCLFCHGFEERGAQRAGVLAVDFLANATLAPTLAAMALRLAARVTIFTDGDAELAKLVQEHISAAMDVDSRKIARLEKLPDRATVKIHLRNRDSPSSDGQSSGSSSIIDTVLIDFIVHTPRTEHPVKWETHLSGLQVTEQGHYETASMFSESTLPGVFVAGDCAQMLKAVAPAIHQGGLVGAGIAHQLALLGP